MQAVTELKRHESPYDYTADRDKLKRFILFFRKNGEYKYLSQLRSLEDKIDVDLDDVRMYDQTGLASRMAENAWSYTHQLFKVVDELLYSEEVGDEPVDVFYNQRIARFKEKYPEKNVLEYFPSCILRNYVVSIRPGVQSARNKVLAIRDVGAEDVGRLISVRGVEGTEEAREGGENRSNQRGKQIEERGGLPLLDYRQMADFIEHVKTINPTVPASDNSLFISSYLKARKENSLTTPRMLLAMIRLALAHARLHGRSEVSSVDIDEARNLLEIMRVPVVKPAGKLVSTKQAVYNAIVARIVNKAVNIEDLYESLEYSREVIDEVINDFANTGIWVREENILKIFN